MISLSEEFILRGAYHVIKIRCYQKEKPYNCQ